MKIQELPADEYLRDCRLMCSPLNSTAYIGRAESLTFTYQSTVSLSWQKFARPVHLLNGIRCLAIVNSLLSVRSELSAYFLSPGVSSILWMR